MADIEINLKDLFNFNDRKVNRTIIKNHIISTMYSSDHGYETAIIVPDHNIYPVERYFNKEQAKIGHELWCEKFKNNDTVTIDVIRYFNLPPLSKTLILQND